MAEKVKSVDRRILIAGIVGIIVLLSFIIYKFFGDDIAMIWDLLSQGDQDQITAFLNSKSALSGYLILFISCILQVISIFFPGMVLQISGALIFGWWKAFLICWIGFVFGNVLVFFLARVFRESINMTFTMEKKSNWLLEKINNGNQIWVVALACLIPGIPNGIIPYLAARTKITLSDFALAVAGASWIQIILNCIAGHFLARGQYLFMVFAFAVQIILIALVAKNRDKLLKK